MVCPSLLLSLPMSQPPSVPQLRSAAISNSPAASNVGSTMNILLATVGEMVKVSQPCGAEEQGRGRRGGGRSGFRRWVRDLLLRQLGKW